MKLKYIILIILAIVIYPIEVFAEDVSLDCNYFFSKNGFAGDLADSTANIILKSDGKKVTLDYQTDNNNRKKLISFRGAILPGSTNATNEHLQELKSIVYDQKRCPRYLMVKTKIKTSRSIFKPDIITKSGSSGYLFFADDRASFDAIASKYNWSIGDQNSIVIMDLFSDDNSSWCDENVATLDSLKSDLKKYEEKWQKELEDFYDSGCDEFELTEEEKNSVASIGSFKRYEACEGKLTYKHSLFESLKDNFKPFLDHGCISQSEFDDVVSLMDDYQGKYDTLEDDLKDAFNGLKEPEKDDNEDYSESDPVDSGDNYDVTPQSVCVSPSYRKPMRFIGWILGVIRYLVPLVIIVLGAFDFYKSMASSDAEKGSKASIKSLIVRVGAGVFIFLLPGIIEFILGFVSTWNSGNPEYDYSRSWACCGECIFNSNCDVSGDTSSYCK